jgi:hypothetical protein
MEDYLYQKDLFLPLGGIGKNMMAMKVEEWEVLDKNKLGTIRLILEASMDFNIVITEISSANGYNNTTSPNTY